MLASILRYTFILFCLIGHSWHAMAQDACFQVLNTAQRNFENGYFYEIPEMLRPCIDRGFTREQKITGLALLAKTLLYLDRPEEAEVAFLSLLELDPEYKVDPEQDAINLYYLSRKFTTAPIFTWTIAKGGMGLSGISVINRYGTYNTDEVETTYKPLLTWQVSGGLALRLNNYLSLACEPGVSYQQFEKQVKYFGEDDFSRRERQFWVDLPVFLQVTMPVGRYQPYAYLGHGVNILMGARADYQLVDNRLPEDPNANFVSRAQGVDMIQQRNTVNRTLLAGVGVRKKIGYNFIGAEVRYTAGLTNLSKVENKYNGGVSVFDFGDVDDDFRLNNWSLQISYIKPLYKPRKIQKATPRNFLKSISGSKSTKE
jgi:hypothetical protein